MNRIISYLLVGCLCLLTACSRPSTEPTSVRRVVNVDVGWLFTLTDYVSSPYAATGVADSVLLATPDYADADWRALNVPHDWAIEGEFSKDNPSGTGGGALPGGIGWYRKHFTLASLGLDGLADDERFLIRFDGVYMNSTVWLNGHELGTRPYGYISFEYDMTPYINKEGDNVLAVRVDNSDQPNSRWYSGCGIFRSVFVTAVNPVHIVPWDTYVLAATDTSKAYTYSMVDSLVVTVENNASVDAGTMGLGVGFYDREGNMISWSEKPLLALAGQRVTSSWHFSLPNVHRWSVDDPYLYTVRVQLVNEDSQIIDDYSFRIGFRDFRFDPATGFSLNGESMKMNGVCLHHDLGCLGSAVNRRAIQRQLEILRGMGVNAVRCSHNPPSVELLDLCDEMGFVVMDEAFDMWYRRKTERDYARFFTEWHERDLSDLVRRDRNHPSVVMWSIGNEVLEQWGDASADGLSLEEANMILNAGHEFTEPVDTGLNFNQRLTRHLCDIVRHLDPSRPITAGCNAADTRNNLFCEGGVDIIGFNYHEYSFPQVPEWFPGRPFIISESVSALQTRGYYVMPSDSVIVAPSRWDRPYSDPTFMCSAYDNSHAPWSSTHECNLHYYNDLPFIGGQFIWSGFDYIGEPTPYGWPARSSYFGVVDLAGFPKDVYYLYQSEWTDGPMLHVFPHWNWEPGQQVDLWAYFNQADEAELFVNGVSKGVRTKGKDFHTMWRVPFEPGEVCVVTRRDGEEVLSETIRTAGEPAALRLTADRKVLMADGRDLSFITVDVVDADGNLCPLADNLVQFEVSGPAFIAGVDNGCQTSMESFKAPLRQAFHGKCLVVVQNDGHTGRAVLKATADGLRSDKVALSMK